jgi:archaellum component FlaC
MSTPQPEIDPTILEAIKASAEEQMARIVKVFEVVVEGLNGRMNQIDSTMESLEERLAMITVAYAELASMITALVAKVGQGSPEEVEDFNRLVMQQRRDMMNLLRENSEQPFTPHEPVATDPQQP